MIPANDPTVDFKTLVRRGYDRCADRYNAMRAPEPPAELSTLMERLASGARVLDMGCGAGVPITRTLADCYEVTGIDFSCEQIQRAKLNVPQALFIEADLMAVDFSLESFDAVVAFFVLFHLPRNEQRKLLQRAHNWLVPGGFLLATISVSNEPPYEDGDFFGVPMCWTNFGREEYIDIIHSIGFDVLHDTAVEHGFCGSYTGEPECHPLLLARKSEQPILQADRAR